MGNKAKHHDTIRSHTRKHHKCIMMKLIFYIHSLAEALVSIACTYNIGFLG